MVVRPTQDVEAYNLYLKGRYYLNLRRPKPAIAEFEAAIDRDPRYAAAYLGLADSYCIWGFYGGIPTWEAFARARWATERAQELTPDSPDVHLSLGLIEHYFGWDMAREEREIRTVLEKTPRSTDGHFWLGLFLGCSGRVEESLEIARHGLDPRAAPRQPPDAARLVLHVRGPLRGGSHRSCARPWRSIPTRGSRPGRSAWPTRNRAPTTRRSGSSSGASRSRRATTASTSAFSAARWPAPVGARTPSASSASSSSARSASTCLRFDRAVVLAPLGRTDEALDALERAYEERNALHVVPHLPSRCSGPSDRHPRWKALAERLARTAPVNAMQFGR